MQASIARLQNPTKLALAACLAIGLLTPTGCKSGESWAPKMPKFGMPELAFGSKKKDDEIKPPAMNFSPEGDRGGSIAELPSRNIPGSSLVAAAENNSRSTTRAPYAVEDDTRSLADIARQSGERLAQDTDRIARNTESLARDRSSQYLSQGRDSLQSAQDRLGESISQSRLLPSDRNSSSAATITGIPGGPLGNTLGGSSGEDSLLTDNARSPLGDARNVISSPTANRSIGLPPAPQSSTRLAANPFPPANTGLLPPASPLDSTPEVTAIPSREPASQFAGQASVNSTESTLPMANVIPPASPQSQQQTQAAYTSSNPGLTPPANFNTQPNMGQPSMAQPSPTGGFRPGSTGNSVSMVTPGTTTRQPLTAGYSNGLTPGNSQSPGVNSAGVISNPYQQMPSQPNSQPATTLPQYPSTNFGTFQSPTNYPTQPINSTAPNNSRNLPAFPGTTTSYRPNSQGASMTSPNTGIAGGGGGAHAGAPAGMVCDGDQCYLPQQ